MKRDLFYKWIAALESDEYVQTKGALNTDSGHCCLGVLCAVAGLEKKWHRGINAYAYLHGDTRGVVELPPSFAREVGMNTDGKVLKTEDQNVHPSLIELNDAFGSSFKKISKHLRRNPENWIKSVD